MASNHTPTSKTSAKKAKTKFSRKGTAGHPWLSAGVVAMGVGAALSTGTGVAFADTTSSPDGAASSSADQAPANAGASSTPGRENGTSPRHRRSASAADESTGPSVSSRPTRRGPVTAVIDAITPDVTAVSPKAPSNVSAPVDETLPAATNDAPVSAPVANDAPVSAPAPAAPSRLLTNLPQATAVSKDRANNDAPAAAAAAAVDRKAIGTSCA